MKLNNFFLIFLFLLQIIINTGYFYGIKLNILFSFSSIFDEEFVILFAMFLVLCLSYIYGLENFSVLFNERINYLKVFFLGNFDKLIFNINDILSILDKFNVILNYNGVFFGFLSESLLLLINHNNVKNFNILLNFYNISIYYDHFLTNYNFLIKKL
jgi:hypothetical protein